MNAWTLEGQVLFADGVLRPGAVTITGAHISAVRACDTPSERIIAPGFIDLQINGAFGHDFTADPDKFFHVASALLPTGVTAFLPTLITAPLETYWRAFAALSPLSLFARDGRQARILGLHLEGPYLSPKRPGAHNPAHLRARADPQGDGLLNPHVRLMTLAPELENSSQAIRDLRAQGVSVSVGHSAASYEQVIAALDAGMTYGTHLFNAMTPLHHREPGVIGALLADERATVGFIADGVHSHPSLLRWVYKAKGARRITLVTDAMAAAGFGPGEYRLGDRRVQVSGTSARLEDGTLAGSILTMDQAVRNVLLWDVCELAEALTMASTTPADLLGQSQLGRIAEGCFADLVVLDETLHVQQTIVGGQVMFTA